MSPCLYTSNFSQTCKKISQALLEKKKNGEGNSVVLLEQEVGMESV